MTIVVINCPPCVPFLPPLTSPLLLLVFLFLFPYTLPMEQSDHTISPTLCWSICLFVYASLSGHTERKKRCACIT
ncbi:MAG: hypothetical protein J3R72DRAFT_446988 [Linnemannia gamsii]|nr:MAG: hypothetical protein J3R72DRAFT_446988 [Linnemannia gamsii]